MAGLVFLFLALGFALTSRILLLIAALNISAGWAFGVWLPFGPLCFRLRYPEEARRSFYFGLATLPCAFMWFMLATPTLHYNFRSKPSPAMPAQYALEKKESGKKEKGDPNVQLQPTVEERRAANTQEFERLRAWNEKLRLRKRDLLRSDKAGNTAYNAELAEYNQALAHANAERSEIWPAAK